MAIFRKRIFKLQKHQETTTNKIRAKPVICALFFYRNILKSRPHTNALIGESSPYLLQHAHNPVNWKPYSEAVLQEAKQEKKLIILSIGYAACHWCHVMEHESFEDDAVATVMNKGFISVKVDREERPDIDQVYIKAIQLMTGSAGWPLHVVTLPDGRPVWGGTYFRKNDWINALEQILEIYHEEPEKLIAYANRLETGINNLDLVHLNTNTVDFLNYPISEITESLSQQFDTKNGGFSGAPKFMMPNQLAFLLRQAVERNDTALLKIVTLSLDKMAFGGIFDQIGGGFARYSTDEKWHVPHFEKMLYDNGQLVSLYCDAYLVTKNQLYKEIVEETLRFIAREMTHQEGGFYSSIDADSIDEHSILKEGAFYTYTSEELQELLKDDFDLFKEYYNVNNYGAWENSQYVLIRSTTDSEFEKTFGLTSKNLQKKKKNWKTKLLAHRNKRLKPRLDTKILTSWNAIMLKAYTDAHKTFGKEAYLQAALKNAVFLSEKQLQEDGALFHNYKDGKSSINGFLEDYAFTIEAFIGLYQVTLDWKWLDLSMKMTHYVLVNFFDETKKMFYFTSKEDAPIISRSFEYRDNVIPASNSVMAKNLFLLSRYFEGTGFEAISRQMLKNISEEIQHYPSGYTNWLDLLLNFRNTFYEVIVVGNDANEKATALNKHYLPHKILAGSSIEVDMPLFKDRYVAGKTLIYVCENKTCKLPTTGIKIALELMHN